MGAWVGSPGWALAATPTPTPTTGNTPGTVPALEAMATSNAWVAVVALLVAAGLGAGVLVLVHRAHTAEQVIALRLVAGGGSVAVGLGAAAGGTEAAAATFSVSGPDELAVDHVGQFTVPPTGGRTTWTVQGLQVYGKAEKDDYTFLLTPHEVKDTVTVTASDGSSTDSKIVKILPVAASTPDRTAPAPLTVRFVVRNWGLVLVSILIVLGAVALAVAGRLDGGNFVALVAPLAALLGVTAVTAGSGSSAESERGAQTTSGEGK